MSKKIGSTVVKVIGSGSRKIRVRKVQGGYRISRDAKLFSRKADAIAQAVLVWEVLREMATAEAA